MYQVITTSTGYQYHMFVVQDSVQDAVQYVNDTLHQSNIPRCNVILYAKDLEMLQVLNNTFRDCVHVGVRLCDNPSKDFHEYVEFLEWFVSEK